MLYISSGDCATFVKVTDWLALVAPIGTDPKSKLVAERLTAPLVPKPVNLAVCGLPAASSVIVNVPVRVPTPVGVNVTLTEQLVPAATVPQLLVSAKSPAATMLETSSGALPASPSFIACGTLVVLISWAGNTSGFGTAVSPAAFWGLILATQASYDPPVYPVV